ncbi:MAG: hypothetical protein ACI4AB_00160 [Acetatifactor sp.]
MNAIKALSSDEIIIGTTEEGKTIYRKTINIGNLSAYDETARTIFSAVIVSNVSEIIKAYGTIYAFTSSGERKISDAVGGCVMCADGSVERSSSIVLLTDNSALLQYFVKPGYASTARFYVTVEYTKL